MIINAIVYFQLANKEPTETCSCASHERVELEKKFDSSFDAFKASGGSIKKITVEYKFAFVG